MSELMVVDEQRTSAGAAVSAEEPAGLRAFRERLEGGPRIGVADLLGMEIAELEAGRVVFTCVMDDRFANPMGTVHGGIAATLLDSAMGCAAQTVLAERSGYTTVALELKYLRPIALDAGELRAEGCVVHAGRRQVTAEGTLSDAAGRVLATATTTCLVLPAAPTPAPSAPTPTRRPAQPSRVADAPPAARPPALRLDGREPNPLQSPWHRRRGAAGARWRALWGARRPVTAWRPSRVRGAGALRQ